MRHLLRLARPVDAAAALYAATYFVWLAVRTPGTASTELIGNIVFYPAGIAVAWAAWRNAVLPDTDARSRLAWRLLALSALVLWISGTAWQIYDGFLGSGSWPGWVDHLEFLQHPLAIAAFIVFPGRSFSGRHRARFLLDAVIVAVAGLAIALYFGLRLWLVELKDEPLWTAIQGPGVDWVVLVVAAIGAIGKRDSATRGALALLVAAATSYVVANYYFDVAYYHVPSYGYVAGDAVDGLWFAAWAFRWAAARWYWYARTLPQRAPHTDGSDSYESAWFAYLVAGGCFLLLTSQVGGGKPWSVELLAPLSLVILSLLLWRQLLELRESEQLVEARAAQEARFRSLVEHSSDAVLILDRDGVVAYASGTTPAVFGPHVALAPGARLPDVVREDDRAALEPVLAGPSRAGRLLLHVPAGDNGWRGIEAVWTDQRSDPAVSGIVVNCRDVTARRELERQLRHAQKLDAVGQLAGGLAHDVNNALAVVGGYAELLKDELPAGSAGASDLAHVQQAVDRAASITRKVLAFTRKQASQPTALRLSDVVRDLLPLLRQSVTPQVEVRLDLAADLWTVRADRGQIEQVLVNLATNARDAMPHGGTLTIGAANRRVGPSAQSPGSGNGDSVVLTVRDTGSGMAPEVLQRIFEPFFSTKVAIGGTGLGLAMVHSIVEASGGRIEVDSAPGQGSLFTVTLRRAHAAVATVATRALESLAPARGKTVLVVDDEDHVRLVARRMLERHGYQVRDAASGSAALELIGDPAISIDILLTDLVMPGMDGRQLIARAAALRPGLPVICMTGFAGSEDDTLRLGGNLVTVMSKPFAADALLKAVGSAGASSAGS